MGFHLSGIDLAIIGISLVVTVAIGILVGRKQDKSARGYFLASGRMPWYIIGSAFVSTSVSSEQIVGTIGAAYTYGMGVANWEWFTLPHYTLFILVFVPIYLRNRITTIPEFLTRRYGPLCGDIYSWMMLAAFIFVFLVPVLYGGSLAFSSLTGLDFYFVLWAMVILVGLYTIKGGLSSVMWTDAAQCVMLVGGGIVLFFLALKQTPGGWGAMMAADPERFHLYHPANDVIAPFLGALTWVFTGGVFYQAGNQIMMQRILGARSRWDGMMGVVLAGFINLLRPLVTCFLGFIVFYWVYRMRVAAPLEKADLAFPFALEHMSPGWGLRGLILAGFLAAVMSTVSAQVNSSATIFSMDVYRKFFNKQADDRALVRAGRIASLFVLVIAALCAPLVGLLGGIFRYFQTGVAYLSTPFASVILLGIFWKRMNYQGAVAGLLGGIVLQASVVVVLWALGINLHWFYNAFIAEILIVITAIIVASRYPAPPEDQWKAFLWRRSVVRLDDEGMMRPWYHSWVLWFCVYAAIWFYLYWLYW